MGEQEYVSPDFCALHREVLETKIAACDKRIDGIIDEIREVRNLQKTILYALILVGFGVACTLAGVILGRGIDFGWLVP